MHPGQFRSYRLRAIVSIPGGLYNRFSALRRRLEGRLGMRLAAEEFFDYLVEKAIEKLEEWEKRTRRTSGTE